MTDDFNCPEPRRFMAALSRFDEENARDPNTLVVNGETRPRELVYAEWLTGWVLKLCPSASEALRLAARSQHLCRWQIPRDTYPAGRAGYLQWREALKRFHAQKSGEVLQALGYDKALIARVQELNLKRRFPSDAESRILEDALCLVFFERQFSELAAKAPDDKMVAAIQKVWDKMTAPARQIALGFSYAPRERALLDRAWFPKPQTAT